MNDNGKHWITKKKIGKGLCISEEHEHLVRAPVSIDHLLRPHNAHLANSKRDTHSDAGALAHSSHARRWRRRRGSHRVHGLRGRRRGHASARGESGRGRVQAARVQLWGRGRERGRGWIKLRLCGAGCWGGGDGHSVGLGRRDAGVGEPVSLAQECSSDIAGDGAPGP